jgi:hypothetical protein
VVFGLRLIGLMGGDGAGSVVAVGLAVWEFGEVCSDGNEGLSFNG